MKTEKLNYIVPSHEQLISYTSGIRPYREEGIRLEKEVVHGRQIFHNYGHGGGGLSLGWGCAKYIIESLFLPSQSNKSRPVAVLGSGIIGLSTALQLVEKGFRVNLYANNFPYNTRPNQPEITTTVAAGLWMPVKISAKSSLKDLSLWTLDHLYEVLKTQTQTKSKLGITEMDCYIVNDTQAELYSTIKGIVPYNQIKVTFDGSQFIDAISFKTLVIESSFYVPYLMEKLKQSGLCKIIQKHFDSPSSMFQLAEESIFNCLGFSGNKFFEDPSRMKAVKGHIATLQPSPSVMNFILFMKTGSRFILQIPHQQRGVLNLGVTFEENNTNPYPDKKEIDTLIATARDFFLKVDTKNGQRAKL